MESSAPFVGVFHENFTKKLPRNFPDNRMQKGSPIISNFLLRSLFFNCILFFVVINSVDSAHQSVVFYNEISPSVQITLQDEGTLEFQEKPFEIAFHCDFVP